MKKLLYFCTSLMCLALAAGVLALSGAGALRLLREPAKESAAVQPAAPSPAPAAAAEPAPAAEKATEAEKAEPAASAPAEKAAPAVQPGTQVYTGDFERVMKNSAPGKAVSNYATQYEAVMTKNINLLNNALKDRKKRYNTQAVKKALDQFTKQKSSVRADARTIISGLVRSAAASSPLKDALLIDRKDALSLPEGFDRTAEVIALIDKLKLNLPDPPKPITIN
ncbi:MAG: hypothetical protein IJU32_04880 [Pyramidobacter sp.]|nr:hypothetical protein [Pyramidobacter sp.]